MAETKQAGAGGASETAGSRQHAPAAGFAVGAGICAPGQYEILQMGGDSGINRISENQRYYLKRRVKETDNIPDLATAHDQTHQARKDPLGEWLATGICGNNITSSALYVVALCSVPAGKYAPLALACIAGLLYLFRRIYEEVVTALPVNGGTYNLLLNTTTKANASIAACLTMLSYVTTAVISATSAMRYIHTLCDGGCTAIGSTTDDSVIITTLITLWFAAFLNVMGITESAAVALVIFLFHMLSMVILVVASFAKAVTDMPMYSADAAAAGVISTVAAEFNYSHPEFDASCACTNYTYTNVTAGEQLPMLSYNWLKTAPSLGIGSAIYFGYSSALLGISGFESSSNYVENQAPGVFPKTLRNMWVAVTFINPTIALLAQCLLPVEEIAGQAEEGALLSIMAEKAAGNWLKVWIVIDATLVLVGAVITAFVGFTGLSHRMTVDRCLPQVLLRVNKMRKTRHVIIGMFWALTSALVLYTWGNVEIMAGVYTVAFLSVMLSFTVGNMLLKLRRSTLPTPVHVDWSIVILACLCVAAGLVGNIVSRPRSLPSLLIFGAVFILPVQMMLNRVRVLSIIAALSAPLKRGTTKTLHKKLVATPDAGGDASSSAEGDSPGDTGKVRRRSFSFMQENMTAKARLDSLFFDIVRSVHELLDADRATLWLIDHENQELWSKVAEGIPAIRVPKTKGVVGWVCSNSETLNIHDAYQDSRFNPAVDKKTGYVTRSILCCPVRSTDDRMVGIMQVINKLGPLGSHFTRLDTQLLEDFCSHIGPAVENCQHADLTGDELRLSLLSLRRELESTRSMLRGIRRTGPMEQFSRLIAEVVRSARKLVSADRCTLWLVDHESKMLWTRFAEKMPSVRIPMSTGVVGWVASGHASTLNVENAYRDARFNQSVDKKTGYHTHSILCCQILGANGEVLGVLQAINKLSPGASKVAQQDSTDGPAPPANVTVFTQDDERLATDFCKDLATTVQFCNLLGSQDGDLTETLQALTSEVAAIKARHYHSYDDIFAEGLRTAAELLDAEAGAMFMVEAPGDAGGPQHTLRRVAEHNCTAGAVAAAPAVGIIEWVLSHGDSVHIADAQQDSRFAPETDGIIAEPVRSLLARPICAHTDAEVVAVVTIVNKSSGRVFSKEDELILDSFCEHMRAAVENKRRESVSETAADRGDSGGDESQPPASLLVKSTVGLVHFESLHESFEEQSERATVGTPRASPTASLNGDQVEVQFSKEMLLSGATGTSDDTVNIALQNYGDGDDGEENLDTHRRCICCCCWCKCLSFCNRICHRIHTTARAQIMMLTMKPIVFFTKTDEPEELNTAIRYMLNNEQRRWIKFVKVVPDEEHLPEAIPRVYDFLAGAYPEVLIEYTIMIGKFGPEAVSELSSRTHIPTTFMFMGSFSSHFEFSFTEMGGLRLITDNFVTNVRPTDLSRAAVVSPLIEEIPLTTDDEDGTIEDAGRNLSWHPENRHGSPTRPARDPNKMWRQKSGSKTFEMIDLQK